jgi:hypothetical protein
MEIGNKPSFIGVYTAQQMVFAADCAAETIVVPKLMVPIWLICDKGDTPIRLAVRAFTLPDRTQILQQDIPIGVETSLEPSDDTQKVGLHFQIGFGHFQVTPKSALEIEVETETGTLRAGRLRFVVPPRAQSPSAPVKDQ